MCVNGLYISGALPVDKSEIFGYYGDSRLQQWDDLPDIIAVTMVVPRGKVDRLFTGSADNNRNPGPLIQACIKSHTTNLVPVHVFSSFEVKYGTAEIRNKDKPFESAVDAKYDDKGWKGGGDMIISFYAPSKLLLAAEATIGIGVPPTMDNLVAYQTTYETTNMDANIAEMSVDDPNIFFTRYLPGQVGYVDSFPFSCMENFPDEVPGLARRIRWPPRKSQIDLAYEPSIHGPSEDLTYFTRFLTVLNTAGTEIESLNAQICLSKDLKKRLSTQNVSEITYGQSDNEQLLKIVMVDKDGTSGTVFSLFFHVPVSKDSAQVHCWGESGKFEVFVRVDGGKRPVGYTAQLP